MVNNIFGNNVTSFTKEIYIEFIPDEIILKFISITDDNANAQSGCYLIKTNLVESSNLITFPAAAGYAESVDIPFRNSKPINSTYLFDIFKVDGTKPTGNGLTGMNLSLSLTFLFIKFKSQ